jgi:hypothetical protein
MPITAKYKSLWLRLLLCSDDVKLSAAPSGFGSSSQSSISMISSTAEDDNFVFVGDKEFLSN